MSIQVRVAIAKRVAELLERAGVDVLEIHATENGIYIEFDHDDDIDPQGIGGGGEKGGP